VRTREIEGLEPLDLAMPDAWYAVYTKHQHEKRASEILAHKGFDVLLPLYKAAHKWKDRTKTVSLPVFPSYVFLRTKMDRKLEILMTPGVFWLVENAGRACPIPESDIDAIRKITYSGARVEPHTYLNCGEHVRVRRGPLTGIEGILTRIKNRYRVVLSVEVLQKAVAVEVDAAIVEPLPVFRSRPHVSWLRKEPTCSGHRKARYCNAAQNSGDNLERNDGIR
jgi:transcription antitermination factor NusG